jgi:hypothetical protein
VRALQFDGDSLRIVHEGFLDIWLSGRHKFEVRTFQEALAAKGARKVTYERRGLITMVATNSRQIVDYFSSSLTRGTAERPQSINANNMEMCRFRSKDDDGYRKVVGELKTFVNLSRKHLDIKRAVRYSTMGFGGKTLHFGRGKDQLSLWSCFSKPFQPFSSESLDDFRGFSLYFS